MNKAARDVLNQLPLHEVKARLDIAEVIVLDAIKESVAAPAIQNVIRQRDILKEVYWDRVHNPRPPKPIGNPEDRVIKLKPAALFARRARVIQNKINE